MNIGTSSRRKFIRGAALASLVAYSFPSVASFSVVRNKLSKAKEKIGMIILFQGDSITDGNRGRNTDPNHIMGHGYAFSIASRVGADYPEKRYQFYNSGISGNKVNDLEKRWLAETLDLKPDVFRKFSIKPAKKRLPITGFGMVFIRLLPGMNLWRENG